MNEPVASYHPQTRAEVWSVARKDRERERETEGGTGVGITTLTLSSVRPSVAV